MCSFACKNLERENEVEGKEVLTRQIVKQNTLQNLEEMKNRNERVNVLQSGKS